MNDNPEQLMRESLEKNIHSFRDELGKISSNEFSLERIEKIMIDNQQKKTLFQVANVRITLQKELIIHVFDSKFASLVTKKILDSQLGYRLESKKSNEREI